MYIKINGLSRSGKLNLLCSIANDLGIDVRPGAGRGNYAGFTLRPRGGSDRFRLRRHGRRVAAVCYHGHKFLLDRVFARYPDAIIRSSIKPCDVAPGGRLVYDGASDYQAKAWDLAGINIGSTYQPLEWSQACDCHDYSIGGSIDPADVPNGRHD